MRQGWNTAGGIAKGFSGGCYNHVSKTPKVFFWQNLLFEIFGSISKKPSEPQENPPF